MTYTYYEGYALTGATDEALLIAAAEGARGCDVAVLFVGLPEAYESEGFDRTTLAMPESHNVLVSKVAAANPHTVVVLVGGAPVEMPWIGQVKAVLNLYLAGQAGCLAAAELLLGRVNPSGKLAESYPLAYKDVPSAGFYEARPQQATDFMLPVRFPRFSLGNKPATYCKAYFSDAPIGSERTRADG